MGAANIEWSDAQALFECDGSLRDLYVFNTTLDDWEVLFAALKAAPYRLELRSDGEPLALPDCVAEFLDIGPERPTVLLSIVVGQLRINAHMFCAEEIELDIDPRDVADADQFAAVVGFMTLVADTLGKPVVLTPENSAEDALLVARPGNAGVAAGKGWLR